MATEATLATALDETKAAFKRKFPNLVFFFSPAERASQQPSVYIVDIGLRLETYWGWDDIHEQPDATLATERAKNAAEDLEELMAEAAAQSVNPWLLLYGDSPLKRLVNELIVKGEQVP